MVSCIKGWRTKIKRCEAEGRRVRRTARDSLDRRMRTKLIGKTTWFKKRGAGCTKDKQGGGKQRNGSTNINSTTTSTPKSVLFVDQTPGGGLATSLRELFTRLE